MKAPLKTKGKKKPSKTSGNFSKKRDETDKAPRAKEATPYKSRRAFAGKDQKEEPAQSVKRTLKSYPAREKPDFKAPERESRFKKADATEERFSKRPERESRFKKDDTKEERYSKRPERESRFKKEDNNEERYSRKTEAKPYKTRRPYGASARKTSSGVATSLKKDGKVRLNKYIAHAGICSRREADDLIKAGTISVNGEIITEMGYRVDPDADVRYEGARIKQEDLHYVLLNKPKDFITTMDDPQGRKTVMQLVKGATKERIYPVGRLDRNTTGLLLFTNDGELAKKLLHPKHQLKKLYHVILDKNVSVEHMHNLTDGIELEDGIVKADDVQYTSEGRNKKEVGIEMHLGKNRIVRRMFEHLGYKVIKLDRVMFAGLTKKDLPRGKWRHLTEQEIINLKIH